jgi:hypothetical protein
MKQQILNLKKKLLIVELPNYITEFTHHGKTILTWDDNIKTQKCYGKLTDITEDQFQNWVDFVKEIFFSHLEKEGVYFSNPLDWEKKAYFLKGSENSWGHDDLKRWQEAEEKVWDKNRTYIFDII